MYIVESVCAKKAKYRLPIHRRFRWSIPNRSLAGHRSHRSIWRPAIHAAMSFQNLMISIGKNNTDTTDGAVENSPVFSACFSIVILFCSRWNWPTEHFRMKGSIDAQKIRCRWNKNQRDACLMVLETSEPRERENHIGLSDGCNHWRVIDWINRLLLLKEWLGTILRRKHMTFLQNLTRLFFFFNFFTSKIDELKNHILCELFDHIHISWNDLIRLHVFFSPFLF